MLLASAPSPKGCTPWRGSVGKARADAAKSCCPGWPRLKRRARRRLPVLLEKQYDAQLPATTVGEKRPASHWRRRESDETFAKAV